MGNLVPQDSSAAMKRLKVSKPPVERILVTGKKNCRYKRVTGCHRLPYDKGRAERRVGRATWGFGPSPGPGPIGENEKCAPFAANTVTQKHAWSKPYLYPHILLSLRLQRSSRRDEKGQHISYGCVALGAVGRTRMVMCSPSESILTRHKRKVHEQDRRNSGSNRTTQWQGY
ncbi:predicted protein [Histoplasma capsulatum G186AR]|uniref:Uncharacterized protein n=1 Tax=Ajellomyces capsulatus (strain G186AR / H82 / ATCC MYA-2454 / RMSCC 2432) TaxID=447093 RepID=C0NDG2_AJECG|nr:uncharacterized protein HCBG_01158 [Histoplasma capsulatum G186AR]EEH11703.1 predicted protein [Histoplasma capsulatum G186AR]